MSGHGGQRPNPRSAEHLIKRMQVDSLYSSRRPVPHSASDLLGPGIASKAVRTFDWNADELAFNGLFYSEPGAQNGPDTNRYWMGFSEATPDGYGIQHVWEFRNPDNPTLPASEWTRLFSTTGLSRTFGVWISPNSGLLRNVISTVITTGVGPVVGAVNIGSVVIPYPVLNRRYRVTFNVSVQVDVAGNFSTTNTKYGVGATTGGTVITEAIKDARTAGRREGITLVGEFVCPVASGTSDFRVVATTISSGGGNVTTTATSAVPSLLSVDEIVP